MNADNAVSFLYQNLKSNHEFNTHLKFMPKSIKPILHLLYYFDDEMKHLQQTNISNSIKIGKLTYWRDTVKDCYQGKVQREPFSIILSDSIEKFPLPEKPFHLFLDTIEQEIKKPQTSNLEEYVLRCREKTLFKYLILTKAF